MVVFAFPFHSGVVHFLHVMILFSPLVDVELQVLMFSVEVMVFALPFMEFVAFFLDMMILDGPFLNHKTVLLFPFLSQVMVS